MRNAIAILPVVSAIYPMITRATAPPTIVMISNEEASLVFVPASLNASEKIVGNTMLPCKAYLHFEKRSSRACMGRYSRVEEYAYCGLGAMG